MGDRAYKPIRGERGTEPIGSVSLSPLIRVERGTEPIRGGKGDRA